MIEVTDLQLQTWLQGAFWPLVRISGMMMSAPLIGERYVSTRIRIIFALAMLLAMMPVLPEGKLIPPFTSAWWFQSAAELAFGILLGFILRIGFEAIMLAGELIGFGMGLGFARLADPIHGSDSPTLGSFLRILAMLLFLATGGHLRLIEALAESFKIAPGGTLHLSAAWFETAARLAWLMFEGALSIALPLMAAMLVVNLAFGVMNRSTPSLNATSVGFPISLTAGMMLLGIAIVPMLSRFQELMTRLWQLADALLHS